MEHITLHWYACKCSGVETVAAENLEAQKELLRKVFGAYRFEIFQTIER